MRARRRELLRNLAEDVFALGCFLAAFTAISLILIAAEGQ